MFDNEDYEIFDSIYVNGHWEWNDKSNDLQFISDLAPTEDEFGPLSKTIIRAVEFKDDIDLWEQQKFRKRLQRKTTEGDVVMLQDVKDVVLFTAPSSILSPAVINMLHLPTTERFLRALILYSQYFLQISDVMNNRTLELETKIHTSASDDIESKYLDDLEDLRVIVAKEYCTIIIGDEKFSKYHHMGTTKRLSLSKKDAIFFETIIRIGIQIVWIALGRKHFNVIEIELNRIFKSDVFNSAEHRVGIAKTNPRERYILIGDCAHPKKKVNTNSPLINEMFCHRNIDFRMFGLGATKYTGLDSRLLCLESYLSEPEHKFSQLGISLGIIGLLRSRFDIMLKEIKIVTTTSSFSSTSIRHSLSRTSRSSKMISRKSVNSTAWEPQKLYPDIYLPAKESTPKPLPDAFPHESLPKLTSHEGQRIKWIARASRRRRKIKNSKPLLNKIK